MPDGVADSLVLLAALVVVVQTWWTRRQTLAELHTIRQLLEQVNRRRRERAVSEQNPEVEVVPDPVVVLPDEDQEVIVTPPEPESVPDEDEDGEPT